MGTQSKFLVYILFFCTFALSAPFLQRGTAQAAQNKTNPHVLAAFEVREQIVLHEVEAFLLRLKRLDLNAYENRTLKDAQTEIETSQFVNRSKELYIAPEFAPPTTVTHEELLEQAHRLLTVVRLFEHKNYMDREHERLENLYKALHKLPHELMVLSLRQMAYDFTHQMVDFLHSNDELEQTRLRTKMIETVEKAVLQSQKVYFDDNNKIFKKSFFKISAIAIPELVFLLGVVGIPPEHFTSFLLGASTLIASSLPIAYEVKQYKELRHDYENKQPIMYLHLFWDYVFERLKKDQIIPNVRAIISHDTKIKLASIRELIQAKQKINVCELYL